MAKISMIITLGLILAAATQATLLNTESFSLQDNKKDDLDEKHIKYYMACARGGLSGFFQGFYKNASETISSECLGETTYQHFYQFISFLTSGKITEIFKSLGMYYQFTYDVQKNCRSNQIMFEVVGFCLNSTNNCSINGIIENFTKNIFSFTGAINTIAQTAVEVYANRDKTDLKNLDAASAQFSDIGKNLGDIIRRVLGFTKTESNARKPRNPVTPALFV